MSILRETNETPQRLKESVKSASSINVDTNNIHITYNEILLSDEAKKKKVKEWNLPNACVTD